MTALLALVRKDLLLYLSDRRALLMHLLLPVLLGAFFGYLFGGDGNRETSKIEIAWVATNADEVTDAIYKALREDTNLQVTALGEDEARALVKKGKLSAAVVMPAGFGKAAGAAFFGAGTKPEIGLVYDPSQSVVIGMLKGLLTQHVMQTVSANMFDGKQGKDFMDDSLAQLTEQAARDPQAKELSDFLRSVRKFQDREAVTPKAASGVGAGPTAGGLSTPFSTHEEALSAGPRYNSYAHAFAGMCVQFILFMGVDAGIGILMAQRLGLWGRLLAAPVSLRTLLLGRGLSASLIAMGLLCAVFAIAALLFNVRIEGSALGFAGVGLCFALMTSAFGLLIAAFGRTPEAARSISTFATLLMVMLGGAWAPSFIFPAWMQTATLIVPTRWAVDGLDAVTWRGLDLAAVLPAMGVLLAFAALFAGLALWRFGRNAR